MLDVTTVILFTRNLVMTYHYWISKLLWQKLWLVDTVIIRVRSPRVGKASENLMNHLCPEKSQPFCPSSRRSEWDVIVTRIQVQVTKLLRSVRHVSCTSAWIKRETVSWRSFVVFDHDYIAYHIPSWKWIILVLIAWFLFYLKYRVFYILEYICPSISNSAKNA